MSKPNLRKIGGSRGLHKRFKEDGWYDPKATAGQTLSDWFDFLDQMVADNELMPGDLATLYLDWELLYDRR